VTRGSCWVSTLAYPNLLGLKGFVVVVVVVVVAAAVDYQATGIRGNMQ
jgi:hypothetical protein